MPHMVPEYLTCDWWEIECDEGTMYVPAFDLTAKQARESFTGVSSVRRTGEMIGVRMSAPGYLDASDWDVFTDECAARDWVRTFYGVDPESGEPLDEDSE